jgi:hypothetical protein
MRRIFVYILLVSFLVSSVSAQRRRTNSRGTERRSNAPYRKGTKNSKLEEGEFKGIISATLYGPGPGYLFGDIGGSPDPKNFMGATDWVIKDTRTYWGLGSQIIFPGNFGLRANFNTGSFVGDDMRSRNIHRGWSYSTNIYEGTLQGMFVFLGGTDEVGGRHMVYGFLGIGYFYSTANFAGSLANRLEDPFRRIDLIKSNEFNTSIPFGVGYQFRIDSKWSVGAEFAIHYYLSDFVDGISTAYSRSEDVISALNLTVTYNIKSNECKTCGWSIQGKDRGH